MTPRQLEILATLHYTPDNDPESSGPSEKPPTGTGEDLMQLSRMTR